MTTFDFFFFFFFFFFLFSGGLIITHTFGQGSGPIWMANVNCTGEEEALGFCDFPGWGIHECAHSQDASVECEARNVTTEGKSYL